MLDVVLDALLDSLKIFGIAFLIYFIFSFVHEKITHLFQKHQKISPLIGSACGLIPECGISIVASDMYHKKEISRGTVLAIFFACSDEALFILLSDVKSMGYVLPLLAIKFVFAFALGYLIDRIKKPVLELNEFDEVKLDCCKDHHQHESKLEEHFLHPLLHCLKIFIYVFLVNLFFGILVYYIKEEELIAFLKSNEFFGPIFAGLVGLIPNCASSILMSELFLMNGLSFGALVTGLSINSGLGLIYLFRFKETRKDALFMTLILFIYSLLLGYIIFGIMRCF